MVKKRQDLQVITGDMEVATAELPEDIFNKLNKVWLDENEVKLQFKKEVTLQQLNDADQKLREKYEADFFESSRTAFLSLMMIFKDKLYRSTHKTFSSYMEEKWNRTAAWFYGEVKWLNWCKEMQEQGIDYLTIKRPYFVTFKQFGFHDRPSLVKLAIEEAKKLEHKHNESPTKAAKAVAPMIKYYDEHAHDYKPALTLEEAKDIIRIKRVPRAGDTALAEFDENIFEEAKNLAKDKKTHPLMELATLALQKKKLPKEESILKEWRGEVLHGAAKGISAVIDKIEEDATLKKGIDDDISTSVSLMELATPEGKKAAEKKRKEQLKKRKENEPQFTLNIEGCDEDLAEVIYSAIMEWAPAVAKITEITITLTPK